MIPLVIDDGTMMYLALCISCACACVFKVECCLHFTEVRANFAWLYDDFMPGHCIYIILVVREKSTGPGGMQPSGTDVSTIPLSHAMLWFQPLW